MTNKGQNDINYDDEEEDQCNPAKISNAILGVQRCLKNIQVSPIYKVIMI